MSEGDRANALAALTRTGLVDDRRYAENRAAALAERGAGNAFIRHDLLVAGVDGDALEHALATLEDESVRAGRIVGRRGGGAKTARYLSRKGFSDDTVRAVVAHDDDDALG